MIWRKASATYIWRHRVMARSSEKLPGVPRPRPQSLRALLGALGPGFITGAADDDPSGIATYAQVGAQFGFGLSWTVVLTTPLMAGVQEISGRLGRVSGGGLGAAMRVIFPGWLVAALLTLLVAANTINLGADIGAMASCLGILIGGPERLYALAFACICIAAEIWLVYRQYVRVLRWLTLSLLSYVGLLFVVHVPWGEFLSGLVVPNVACDRSTLTAVLAVLGTTISPYLFFWQASEEAEDEAGEGDPRPLRTHPMDAPPQVRRIKLDTWLGMALSNLVAVAIIGGTAATLHKAGVGGIDTAADAARALEPLAGPFAMAIFASGVVGTGLLTVPILAGSAAYAISEELGWRTGLNRKLLEARGFYGIIAAATLIGSLIVLSPIPPMKALFWSAVINGVASPFMIAALTIAASDKRVMGDLVIPSWLRGTGWFTAAIMAAAGVGALIS